MEYKIAIEEECGIKQAENSFAFKTFFLEVVSTLTFKLVSEKEHVVDHTKEAIIGGDNGKLVLMVNPLNVIPGKMAAVIDSQNPSRVFIGNSLDGNDGLVELLGMVLLFDENGSFRLSVLDRPVLRMDERNGRPETTYIDPWKEAPREQLPQDKQNMFLCGNTLLLAWIHHDTSVVHFSGAILKGNHRVEATFEFPTKVTARDLDYLGEFKLCMRRWLCMGTLKFVCFDLKSFQVCEPQKKISFATSETFSPAAKSSKQLLKYDVAVFSDSSVSLLDSLYLLKNVPSYDPISDRDGYPVHCVKCGQDTVQGGAVDSSALARGMAGKDNLYGLGKAICTHCFIRYSREAKCWVCFQLREDSAPGYLLLCQQAVTSPNFSCAEDHSYHVKYSVDVEPVKVGQKRKDYQPTILLTVATA